MRKFLLVPLLAALAGCPPTKEKESENTDPVDADADGYSADEDCDDNNAAVNPGAAEVCDSLDNNCDDAVDEAGGTAWYADADADGFGNPNNATTACTAPAGTVTDNTDCDDDAANVNPDAAEVCDANDVDENCDGRANDADPNVTGGGTYYADTDGDGYGDPASPRTACTQPGGYVTEPVDCNDNDILSYPGGVEICDGNDNDCNGQVDDDVAEPTIWYQDYDGDGYGNAAEELASCATPSGYVDNNLDCNDTNAAQSPGLPELCDGSVDENCSGSVDEAGALGGTTYYQDGDGDGFGGPNTQDSCTRPGGYTTANDDCDDSDASIGAASTWYIDADGDGYGDSDGTSVSCSQPSGYVDNASDPLENASATTLAATGDLEEVVDVIATATSVYAVGYDADGVPTVAGVDVSTGSVTVLYSGAPFVAPFGIAISTDESTLYITDVAAEGGGSTAGELFSLVINGGSPVAEGVSGTIDMPGDVANWNGDLLVTGFTSSGTAALYSVTPGSGSATVLYSGAPLKEPLAVVYDSYDGSTYVADARAEGGSIYQFDASFASASLVVTNAPSAFPGGLAVTEGGDATLFFPTLDSDVILARNSAGIEEVLGVPGLNLGTGLAVSSETLYVGDAAGSTDIYSISY
jgi:Putative metal-binding motif